MKQTKKQQFYNIIAGKHPGSPAQTIKLAATVYLKGGNQERVLLSTNQDSSNTKLPVRNTKTEIVAKGLIEGAEHLSNIQKPNYLKYKLM